MNKASIIIPVYNALEETLNCLNSLIKYTPINEDCTIIIIDDASKNPELSDKLKTFCNENISFYQNTNNLGYTRTINKGINLAENRDILLLNSDTEVTPGWWQNIREAAYKEEKIGTVTPLSNSAGEFSVPGRGHNSLPDSFNLIEVSEIVKKCGEGKSITSPTGNGFCMYIRRDLIDVIGMFDEINFPRGYGEENDFCIRAVTAGFKNIVILDTYIFHHEHASFKEAFNPNMQRGLCRLHYLYPSFDSLVLSLIKNPELRKLRRCVSKHLKKDSQISSNTEPFSKFFAPIIYLIKNSATLLNRIKYVVQKEGSKILVKKILRHTGKIFNPEGRLELDTILQKEMVVEEKKSEFGCDLPELYDVEEKFHELAKDCSNFYCYIDNNWGGGAQLYLDKKIQCHMADNDGVLYLAKDRTQSFIIVIFYAHNKKLVCKVNDIEDAFSLSALKFKFLFINELIGWGINKNNGKIKMSIFPPLLRRIAELALKYKIEIKIAIHDYFVICPSYTLTTPELVYCGLPKMDSSKCRHCLDRLDLATDDKITINAWRLAWSKFFKQAKEIICFSENSAEIIGKIYPKAKSKIVIQPHKSLIDFQKPYVPQKGYPLTIGVIGNISEAKGARIIQKIDDYLEENERLIILGDINVPLSNSGRIICHGTYMLADLPNLLDKYHINIGLIPSIWPETFNYVTQECMQLNLPLVSFNLGAQADRIRKYEKGEIAEKIDAESAYDALKKLYTRLYL